MKTHKEQIRSAVRDRYRKAALDRDPLAAAPGCGCCGPECTPPGVASALGYTEEDLSSLPAGANLGLGCGNPHAVAQLKPGETVLDLGCGGGIDCFLAARQVGPQGQVIGVDMTPEMISLARRNAEQAGTDEVSFRLGEIEHLPVADNSVDVILSNCVINLAADKRAVYRDAYRVLKPGGRLAISDVVALTPLPEELSSDLALWSQCAAGATLIEELVALLNEIGFEQVSVAPNPQSRDLILKWMPGRGLEDYLAAARIEGRKPDKAGVADLL